MTGGASAPLVSKTEKANKLFHILLGARKHFDDYRVLIIKWKSNMDKKINVLIKYSKEQYAALNSTYDQQMAAIQTVILINITFSSVIIVVLSAELRLYDIIFGNLDKKFESYALASLIVSFLAFVHTVACLISIVSQIRSCQLLREELCRFERHLLYYRTHETNKLTMSFVVTIISSAITIAFFSVCMIFCIKYFITVS